MKSIKLIFAAVLIFVALGLNGWGQESGTSKDDFGIVIGQIIDPETGKPVNERFFIRFNYVLFKGEYQNNINNLPPIPPAYPISDIKFANLPGRIGYSLITDSKGYFKRKFAPGTYGIILAPENNESLRYCTEMDPMDPKMSEEDKKQLTFIIKVNKGKITQFARKATLGGRIKANLVDKNGNSVDPNTFFKSGIDVYFVSDKSGLSETYRSQFTYDEKRLSVSLFPGIYRVELTIRGSLKGFKEYSIENVMVKKNETTEINFVIDPADPALKDLIN